MPVTRVARGGYSEGFKREWKSYHDGRFDSLQAVVAHYDSHLKLGLNPGEINDLVEFLKSL